MLRFIKNNLLYGFGRKFTIFILAVISAISFTTDLGEETIRGTIQGGTIVGLVFVVAFALFYNRIYLQQGKLSSDGNILSLLFAFFMLFGSGFDAQDNWNGIIGNWMRIIISVTIFVGYVIFFKAVIVWLFRLWEKLRERNHELRNENKLLGFFEKHPMKSAFITLLICWSIYAIIQFPGIITGDVYDQLRQYMGLSSWTARTATLVSGGSEINSHHPVLHTLLIGFIYTFFWRMGISDMGILFMSLSKLIIQACLFSYTIKYMKEIGAPFLFRIFTLVFFSIMPYFPMFGFAIGKDGVFSIFGYACFLILIKIMRNPELMSNWKKMLLYGATFLGFALFRKNGIYILILVLPFVLVSMFRNRPIKHATGKAAVLLVCPIVLCLLVENVVYPLCGIGRGSTREILSIPFQQTARYFAEHGDEVTVEEREVVNRILNADTIADSYNPRKSDPVKAAYKSDATMEDLLDYFHVWFQQMLKHPNTYVQATMNMWYGYFYPDYSGLYMYIGDFEYKPVGDGEYVKRSVDGYIEVSTPKVLKPFVKMLKGAIMVYRKLPAIGLTMSPGMQTWIWMLAIAYMWKKRQMRFAVPMVMQAGVILTSLASPLNGSARYMLLMYYCMPLMLAVTYAVPKCRVENDVLSE